MMTSAAKTNKRIAAPVQAGFTLLEIVMVLSLAAMIIGGAAGMMIINSDDRIMRDSSGKVELLAKRARASAILQQIPYALELRPGGIVRLMPFALAGRDEKTTAGGHSIGGDEEEKPYGTYDEIALDPDITVQLRRWNAEQFLTPQDDLPLVWRFNPDGLCEPITLRYTIDESWQEDTFHPLTAAIAATTSEARK